jgi:hypothetical protein
MKLMPVILILAMGGCAVAVDPVPAPSPQPAAPVEAERSPLLGAYGDGVEETRLRAAISALVSFGTRHTLSETASDVRGIGAARRWVAAEFASMSQACGGCLEVATPSAVVRAPRAPDPTEVVNVLAIQRGSGDPGRVIIISAHLDSRVSDVMNATADAPGANDDASGVAAVMEAARVLSAHRFPATIVYAALSGEEQGLLGGKILADYALSQRWRVAAVLNNDIIGNSLGSSGVRVDDRVRVFTEGVRSLESAAMREARIANGGETDSPSRNLARFIDRVSDETLGQTLDVSMIYRRDRFGRGGDQVRMLEAGFPSVRITEAAENYNRQHQDLRTENGIAYGDTLEGIDFAYLTKVTRLNVMALAALAQAPAPPVKVEITGAVSPDTTVRWTPSLGAVGHRIWRRATTDAVWTEAVDAPAGVTELKLPGVVIDDWFFGVSSLSAEGFESPVQFAGPVGEFIPAPAD